MSATDRHEPLFARLFISDDDWLDLRAHAEQLGLTASDEPPPVRRHPATPSGRWQARYPDKTTGRQVPAPHTFKTKVDAARWLAVVEADTLRGLWIDPAQGAMRFDERAERWFATKIHLRANTTLHYEHILRKHLRPFFGERPIGDITTLDIQTWNAHCHARGSHRTAWRRPTRSSG